MPRGLKGEKHPADVIGAASPLFTDAAMPQPRGRQIGISRRPRGPPICGGLFSWLLASLYVRRDIPTARPSATFRHAHVHRGIVRRGRGIHPRGAYSVRRLLDLPALASKPNVAGIKRLLNTGPLSFLRRPIGRWLPALLNVVLSLPIFRLASW